MLWRGRRQSSNIEDVRGQDTTGVRPKHIKRKAIMDIQRTHNAPPELRTHETIAESNITPIAGGQPTATVKGKFSDAPTGRLLRSALEPMEGEYRQRFGSSASTEGLPVKVYKTKAEPFDTSGERDRSGYAK